MTNNNAIECSLMVLGEIGSGKSALTVKFIANVFVASYDPMIEDSYRKLVKVDDIPYMLDILDTAGMEEYSAMRDHFLRRSSGILIVFSVSSRVSFDAVPSYYKLVAETKNKSKLNLPAIILVGSKCDLEGEREVMEDEAKNLARDLKIDYIETSSLTGHNVEECFSQLIRKVDKSGLGTAILPSQKKVGCSLM